MYRHRVWFAAPGGAYLMMRPLRQRSWYRHLDVRWQTDILQILPHSTVLDIKRCAAAVLAREAASAFSGPHPLLRSYNMHASLVRMDLHACMSLCTTCAALNLHSSVVPSPTTLSQVCLLLLFRLSGCRCREAHSLLP